MQKLKFYVGIMLRFLLSCFFAATVHAVARCAFVAYIDSRSVYDTLYDGNRFVIRDSAAADSKAILYMRGVKPISLKKVGMNRLEIIVDSPLCEEAPKMAK